MAEVEFRCFVGGLAWAIDDRSLENAFAQFGVIIESKGKVKGSFRRSFKWIKDRTSPSTRSAKKEKAVREPKEAIGLNLRFYRESMTRSGGSRSNNGGGAQSIPGVARKMVQSLKEIVNCPETEIYAMLKDCNMDPNETVNRLISQVLER
ncbi:RNA polymerase II degradation factor-like protein [Actinidia rufa]|uniref:RNA polymerase II degradation factor-like protein n=1 Tax=Actinidia rufa TaxID=165716 RepID=A0A7J0EGC9_9ERIC|nr:RNA polymerase II degradation factor-like protein [Actinidia rufa]